VAVEFIHTATLLHDDVVDDSKQRRGRPTANLLWDNMSSVLVGDYLFARAFQLMVEARDLRVLGILSDAAATIAEARCCSSWRRGTFPRRRTPTCA
jgi:octaprenyl-diphosphate synthase